MEALWHARTQGYAHMVRAIELAGRAGKQDRDHRAQKIGDVGAMAGEGCGKARSGEARFHNQRGACKQGLVEGVERIGVKQRQGGELHSSKRSPSSRAVFTPHQKY